MKVNYAEIVNDVSKIAASRVPHILAQHPNPYPCGVSWITVKLPNHPFVKYLKANHIGRPSDNGQWALSPTNFCDVNTQNAFATEAICVVIKEALEEKGIETVVRMRID